MLDGAFCVFCICRVEQMKLDLESILNFIKKTVLSKRGLAISLALICILVAYSTITSRVMPMAYGSDGVEAVGADPKDLAITITSVLMAIASFVASNFLGVKPELLQAVVAFEKDKTNPENQRRLGAAILGYLIGVLENHPDGSGGFVLSLLTMLTNKITDPSIKSALSVAATTIANNQFKVSTPETLIGAKV